VEYLDRLGMGLGERLRVEVDFRGERVLVFLRRLLLLLLGCMQKVEQLIYLVIKQIK
jgi:hypothetical protein